MGTHVLYYNEEYVCTIHKRCKILNPKSSLSAHFPVEWMACNTVSFKPTPVFGEWDRTWPIVYSSIYDTHRLSREKKITTYHVMGSNISWSAFPKHEEKLFSMVSLYRLLNIINASEGFPIPNRWSRHTILGPFIQWTNIRWANNWRYWLAFVATNIRISFI